MEPLPTLDRTAVLAQLRELATEPALTFGAAPRERWYLEHDGKRLRFRDTVRKLTGVERFRSRHARAWLKELGIPFAHIGEQDEPLPDLTPEAIEAAWDADLARADSALGDAPATAWRVRHRGQLLPLRASVEVATGAPLPDGVAPAALERWLARRAFELVPPDGAAPRWWIFQGNPDRYDVVGAVRELDRVTWNVNQHAKEIRPQDRVVLWGTGEVGAVAVCTVMCAPTPGLSDEDGDAFLRDEGSAGASQASVWLRIDHRVASPVRRKDLQADAELKELSLLSTPHRTNFEVKPSQARALARLLGIEGPPAARADTLSPRTRDILRVLTRIPVARGQVALFKMLSEGGAGGILNADLQAKLFGEHPNQVSGLFAALSKRINGTELETGAKVGVSLVLVDQKDGRKVARPELWEAIDLLPPLKAEISRPWEEVIRETEYVQCEMPLALAPPRAASPERSHFDALRALVREQRLIYSDETLSAFLLALQAKRFVILSGISGTGKTKLATTLARWAGASSPHEDPHAAVAGWPIELQPYTFKFQRFVLPSALVQSARFPVPQATWESADVEVRWPGGTIRLRMGGEAQRPNVRQLLLKGAIKEWLFSNFQPGDRLVLDIVPGADDGYDGVSMAPPGKAAAASQGRTLEVIPVRPDWRDSRGLLGFYNPITETYSRTAFLDLVLAAGREERLAEKEGRDPRPYFAVLDEMNLAHVEQYFADFLSAMESGESVPLHHDPKVEQGTADGGDAVPMRLTVPRNLFFVGTVNVDETTHMFSPKVLDRAFVLELNEVWLEGEPPAGALRLSRLAESLSMLGPLTSADWDQITRTGGDDAREILLAIQRTLTDERRPLGYRPLFEIARFLKLAFEQGDDSEAHRRAALDVAVLQKILPKLHGTQQELEPVLRRLFDVAVDGRDSTGSEPRHDPLEWRSDGRGRLVVAETAAVERTELALPRCAFKLHRMLRDVRRVGFTSFIG